MELIFILINLINIFVRIIKSMQMYNPLSTRNKPSSHEKSHSSSRFFKKLSTDQNQRNYLNQLDKATIQRFNLSNKNLITLTSTSIKNDQNKQKVLKHKKSTVNLMQINKPVKVLAAINLSEKQNRVVKKESSVKNLKLTTSVQFPQLLAKSISQTTVNRKFDENKIKMFEKIGMRRKLQKPEKNEKLKTEQKQSLKISQFRLGKKLGSGRFGNVFIAQQKETKTIYAIKVMNKLKIKEADMQDQVFWEIKLQMYMNHPNVLKLYGFFDDAKNIYLMLQYCTQCLFKDFRAKTKLAEEESAYYGRQVIAALKYMHNQSIIHRDIKPENIMIQHGVLKMSDFGWSTYAPLYKRQTFCGTVDYVPPEIVQGNTYDESVDIWALGVLLYELSSGYAPFETKNQNVTYNRIVHSQCKYPPFFSKQLKETINKILQKNPSKRPNLQQIENENWFEKYKATGRYISKEIWSHWNNLC